MANIGVWPLNPRNWSQSWLGCLSSLKVALPVKFNKVVGYYEETMSSNFSESYD